MRGPESDRWIVTGFGPFLSHAENPSARLAETLGKPFRVLEVSYAAVDRFLSEINPDSFDTLVGLGLNARARKINLERFGRNQLGKVADVRGCLPEKHQIVDGGPALLPATLWAGRAKSLAPQVRYSTSAGSYLCNYLLYEALRRFPEKRVGFIHVPLFSRLDEATQRSLILDLFR